MRHRPIVGIALLAMLLPAAASGSGYNIYEQGAAALGMAGAGTASVSDASAMFFNPAAMTRLDGLRLLVGGTLLQPVTSFAGRPNDPTTDISVLGSAEDMERQVFTPPTLYLTQRYPSRWAVGIGVNSPYGLGVEWDPKTFTGRNVVTKADLKTLNLGLSAAYEVDPRWSVAVGGNAMFAKVLLRRVIASPVVFPGGSTYPDIAEVELDSDWTPGYGWNAGLSFAPNDTWRFGAMYRGKVVVDIDDGTADFTQILVSSGNPAVDVPFNAQIGAGLPPDQGVSTTLRFPAIWSVGGAWMNEAWTIATDVNLIEWSVFTDLPITFEQTPSQNDVIREDYENAIQVRAGAEHRLPRFAYRFGYYFDQQAAPAESVSPLLPDTNRHGVALGLGFPLGAAKRWMLDLYQLSIFAERADTEGVNRDGFDGEYKSYINAAGFALSYRW